MDHRIKSYRGFYPHHMIRKAQNTLAYSIRNSNNRFIRQVLQKCGLTPYSYDGSQFHYQNIPQPHNDLWHDDALKYKYTFPWSEGCHASHNDKDSYISRDFAPQQDDEPELPESSQILYDNLWYEDALGSTDYGYLDFTDSEPSGSSASGGSYRKTKVSKNDGKLCMTVTCDSSDKQFPELKKRKTTDDSFHDCITISDTEQQVDLTNDSDEPTVVEKPNARQRENKTSKRKYPNKESDEKIPIETKGSGSEPPDSKKKRIQFSQGLVCDYCGHVVTYKLDHHNRKAEDEMKSHFLRNKHNSASLAKIQMSNENTEKAVTILKESILITSTDKHVALVNQIVPMCPKKGCNKVLGTIWACAKHYEMCHDPHISSRYGLANVVALKTILFPAFNTCSTCNFSCSRASKLHKHWKSTQHLKGYLPSSKEQVALYFCPYCTQLHYNFSGCRTHIMTKHKPNGDASMQVVFINSNSDPLELLPIEPRPAEAQGKRELNVLVNMQKGAKVYGITKVSKRKIKAEKNQCKQRFHYEGEDFKKDKAYAYFKRRCNRV
ncbi:uncharacterized protein LOC110467244 [Mizuhopecten yessoensis]|uniref:C2H2-type domain-containing protein n=1 Tax=Mizuhopecten yessoensis TaxID=6573 RepID=A0A210PM87_MIZYE|nr:uncharacterized protein LOC110467244 [Mizuhopecten yessoensis]OWF37609.1 hypothetical protein KP79_PYT10418 [Mizuhopecten yessoensis]